MKTVKRRKRISTENNGRRGFEYIEVETHVYTRKEADKLGVDYCYWRDLRFIEQVPQYVLTDDGCVVELLAHNRRKNKKNNKYTSLVVRTVHQTALYDIKGVNRLTTKEVEGIYGIRCRKLTGKQKEFCELVSQGQRPKDAYLIAYFPTSHLNARLASRKLMTRPGIMEQINENARNVEESGYTYEKHLADLVKLAKESGHCGFDAIKELGKMTGWDGVSKKFTTGVIAALDNQNFTRAKYNKLLVKKINNESPALKLKIVKYVAKITDWDKSVDAARGGTHKGLIESFSEESRKSI